MTNPRPLTEEALRLFQAGLSLQEQGKIAESEKAFRKAIEIQPDFASAWWGLGTNLTRQHKFEENIEVFRKATQLAPDNAIFLDSLGFLLMLKGDIVEGKQILSMAALPWVMQIEENRADIQPFMDSARGVHGSNVDALRDLYPDLDGNMDGDYQTYSKDDIVIAIVDSGIDTNHYDLDGGKVIGWYDAVNGWPLPYDDNGHGTYCAGIAAGEGNGDWIYRGVAPYAALVGVKVMAGDIGFNWDLIEGLEWIAINKDVYGIDVVSISMGYYPTFPHFFDWMLPIIEYMVNELAAMGLVVCVAAGNYNPELEYTRWVAVPGTAEHAITVGASGLELDDHPRASFSAWGNSTEYIKPDVLAPGVNIKAPQSGTYMGYRWGSGTSASASFIAGIAGLFLEDYYMRGYEGDGHARIKHLLMASAEEPMDDDDPPGKDNKNGAGFVDANVSWNFWHNDISSHYTDAEDTLGESTSEQEWWHTDEPMWVADLWNGEDWYKLYCLETIMITVDVWGNPDVVIKIWILNYLRQVLSYSRFYINNHAHAGHVTTYRGPYYVKISVLDYSGDYYDIRIHTIPS